MVAILAPSYGADLVDRELLHNAPRRCTRSDGSLPLCAVQLCAVQLAAGVYAASIDRSNRLPLKRQLLGRYCHQGTFTGQDSGRRNVPILREGRRGQAQGGPPNRQLGLAFERDQCSD